MRAVRRRRAKFKINQQVKLSQLGCMLINSGPAKDWPTKGNFLVLGTADRRDGGQDYLVENIKDPDHFALWVPEMWLEAAPDGGA